MFKCIFIQFEYEKYILCLWSGLYHVIEFYFVIFRCIFFPNSCPQSQAEYTARLRQLFKSQVWNTNKSWKVSCSVLLVINIIYSVHKYTTNLVVSFKTPFYEYLLGTIPIPIIHNWPNQVWKYNSAKKGFTFCNLGTWISIYIMCKEILILLIPVPFYTQWTNRSV